MRRREITEIREHLGLNKKQFAELIGISASSLVGWEKGKCKPIQKHIDKMREVDIRETSKQGT